MFGEQIEVPDVEHTASTMANHVEQELLQQWLEEAGYQPGDKLDEIAQCFKEMGTVVHIKFILTKACHMQSCINL